jgi:hypothetical protein
MKAPRFATWFAKLHVLNRPQRKRVLDTLLEAKPVRKAADRVGVYRNTAVR